MAHVKNSRLNDLMTNAIEGGCAYWMNDPEDVKAVSIKRDSELNVTEIVCTHDVDGKGWKTTTIQAKDIRAALEKARTEDKNERTRERAKSLLTNPDYDDDAEDADVAVQLAIFGEVVFG